MQYSLSVVIITKDRPLQLFECLKSIFRQTHTPQQIIVIEDISDSPQIDFSYFSKACSDLGIDLVHRCVKYRSYAKSRNKGLSLVTTKYMVFVDDDILLPSGTFKRLISFYKDHPKVVAQSGIFLPTKPSNIWTEYGAAFMNWKRDFTSSAFRTFYAPSAFLSLNYRFIKENKIKFDTHSYTGEDWDICEQINKAGEDIYVNRHLKVIHKFIDSGYAFFIRHLQYRNDNVIHYQIKKIPHLYFIESWLPTRRLELLLFPLFIMNKIVKEVRFQLSELRLQKKHFLPALLDSLSIIVALYSSNFAENRLRKVVFKK